MTIQISMKFLSPKKTITRRRTRNRNDIFGGNLADLLQREKTSIPRILKDCVEVIETRGIDEVGIYRVSSVVSEVQKMKDLYSKSTRFLFDLIIFRWKFFNFITFEQILTQLILSLSKKVHIYQLMCLNFIYENCQTHYSRATCTSGSWMLWK